MKVIILAAGVGSRLGRPLPKPLIRLHNGCSILESQLKNISLYANLNDILIVVGFKKELIMEAFPDLTFVYNEYFATTNTSKSLLKGLKKITNEDVLWLNGDVVFEHQVIERILQEDRSSIAVNTARVGEEEVKYTLARDGSIKNISKTVIGGIGEAIGINYIKANDIELFKECLALCKDDDYFEWAIEQAIEKGLKPYPVDVSDLNCVEVDFGADLKQANLFFNKD